MQSKYTITLDTQITCRVKTNHHRKQLTAQRVETGENKNTNNSMEEDERWSETSIQWNQFETFTSVKINYDPFHIP